MIFSELYSAYYNISIGVSADRKQTVPISVL